MKGIDMKGNPEQNKIKLYPNLNSSNCITP